jgi:yecA family protein
MARSVSYSKLESTLNKLGAQLTAAETHGLLTGMLSLTKPLKEDAWRAAVLENLDCAQPTKGQWGVLSAASDEIKQEFEHPSFGFKMLLPNDNTALDQRIDALGYWCRGYLSGLGLVGITKEDLENDVIKELVHDLSQIAHVSVETDASDDDEHNYVELVEYVRVAVQNIQHELKDVQQSKILH